MVNIQSYFGTAGPWQAAQSRGVDLKNRTALPSTSRLVLWQAVHATSLCPPFSGKMVCFSWSKRDGFHLRVM